MFVSTTVRVDPPADIGRALSVELKLEVMIALGEIFTGGSELAENRWSLAYGAKLRPKSKA